MRYNNEFRGQSIDLRPKPRHPKDKRPPTPMPFDVGLRKFRKAVEKAGTLKELRKREFYEKPTAKRKRLKNEAIKRHQKRMAMEMKPYRGKKSFK